MENDAYNRIIKEVCKQILLPLGVFQKGTSRLYIDDNGYFFTVVEFQPSSYSKGTYLNVALHFLWNERDYISFDFPFDSRVKNFVEYQDDEQFACEVTKYAQEAARQVLFYRKLQDIETAKSYTKKWSQKYKGNDRINNLNNINDLDDKELLQTIRQNRTFWRSKPSMKKMKTYEKYDA